ncbi:MAG: VWA domain-containing protein [Eubacteriales bacterium]|nr:VWA domain-containing protein [Eubacteriales bacterium]
MENKMRKNTKGKRFLALVLAAVLMLSVCPVTASAEDTDCQHKNVNPLEAVEPTCTEDGLTAGKQCLDCNAVTEAQQTIPATGHSYDKGKVTQEPTAEEAGVKTYTCSVCGETYTEGIPATGPDHHWDEGKVTTQVTCTAEGVMTYTCTDEGCEETKTETIPATGHSWDEGKVTQEPTAEKAGVKTYTCSVCGETYTEEIPATGTDHHWDEGKVTTPATCTAEGVMTYTCTDEGCEETKTDTIPATGHSYGEPTWDRDEKEENFIATFVCATCGASETVTATIDEDGKAVVTFGDETYSYEFEAAPVVDAEQFVAQIGSEKYETLGEAFQKACTISQETNTTVTVEVLTDCEEKANNIQIKNGGNVIVKAADGANVTVTLTGTGAYQATTVTNSSLTFQNLTIIDTSLIALYENAILTFDNVNLSMDGTNVQVVSNGYYSCAIALENPKTTLVFKNSKVHIENYPGTGSGIRWDSELDGYSIKFLNGTNFTVTKCYSGFTGTNNITIEDSTVNVYENRGNGSNGSNFEIKNSTVNFNNNGSHGLSAGKLLIDNSTVTANGNGGNGIHTNSTLTIQNKSTVTVAENKCSISSKWTIPGAVHIGAGDSVIKDSTVMIQNNSGSGIYQKSASGSLTIEDSANVTIVKNTAEKLGLGGGIYVNGTVTLANNVVLYNNHAGTAGDDIYNVGTITFGKVGSNWALDGAPDCTDAIDGWYVDAENNRWVAHKTPVHVEEFTSGTVTSSSENPLALKAAHKLIPLQPGDSSHSWEHSKSKTATELDENYASKVTLSLPSGQTPVEYDVMFVLDKSKSTEKEQIADEVEKLLDKIQGSKAKVNIGVVTFNNNANTYLPLTELTASSLPKITEAINTTISSGTNIHAGLQKGIELLEAGSAEEKYLILVTDGITYLYNDDAGNGPLGISYEGTAESLHYSYKYGTGKAPTEWENPMDWGTYLGVIDGLVKEDGTRFEGSWNSTGATVNSAERLKSPSYSDGNSIADHAMSADKALLLTYQEYEKAIQKFGKDHVYAVTKEFTTAEFLWGNSFVDYLSSISANEQDIGTIINRDIYYLLDAGSSVKDYIGFVENDYNFDFVNDVSALSLKVGEVTYEAEEIETNKYGFVPNEKGGYDYVVTYNEGNLEDTEHFVWEINVPVTIDKVVQLTYTVKLMNPKTEAGTYGKYDADGAKRYEGLYTNTSAILYPKDSNGSDGVPESFEKPTVEYTVAAKKYNVTYQVTGTIPDGYTAPDGTTVPAGGDYTVEGVPESRKGKYNGKDGTFTFEGWTYNGTKVTELKNIQQDMLLEGVWSFKPDESVTPDPTPDYGKLTIDKSANRTTVRPGKTITYTIKVTNRTGEDLEDIVVSEKLDANLTFVSASGDGNYAVKDGLWTISELKNGKTAKLTIKATVKSGVKNGTVIKNTVVITEAGGDPVPGTPSDTVKVTVSNKISLIPETGDTSNIGLWIGVLVACAVVLGVVLILTVKKKKTR